MKQLHTSKMVSGFRRSLSFPTPRSPRASPVNSGRRHLRSVSLPCRLHPLLSHLHDDLQILTSWLSKQADAIDGLTRIDHLLSSLDDLLHLPHDGPHAQDALRGASWADRLLDDLLRLADAHGTFRLSVVALRQLQSATRAAIRRRDDAQLASCLRSQRRAEKEMSQLAAAVRDVMRQDREAPLASGDSAEAQVAGIVREVMSVTAAASAAVFNGVASVSAAASAPASRWSRCRIVGELLGRRCVKEKEEEEAEKRRRGVMENLEEVEECMGAMEEKSERVFRRLVNARVTLLNLLTPSL